MNMEVTTLPSRLLHINCRESFIILCLHGVMILYTKGIER